MYWPNPFVSYICPYLSIGKNNQNKMSELLANRFFTLIWCKYILRLVTHYIVVLRLVTHYIVVPLYFQIFVTTSCCHIQNSPTLPNINNIWLIWHLHSLTLSIWCKDNQILLMQPIDDTDILYLRGVTHLCQPNELIITRYHLKYLNSVVTSWVLPLKSWWHSLTQLSYI